MQRLYLSRDYAGVLRYDPNTGEFRWLVERNRHGGRIRPGDLAGTPKDGYVQIGVSGELWRAHRLAWLLMTGKLVKEIDHINGDRSDNRWDNLREVTRSQNMLNPSKRLRSNNVSGHAGVSWRADTQKWHARIYINQRAILLGDYTELSDAIQARKRAEKELL